MTVSVAKAVVVAVIAEPEKTATEGTSLIRGVAGWKVVMFMERTPMTAASRTMAQFLGSASWIRR